jgi:NADH:quinone reductase (non-electrogenic)
MKFKTRVTEFYGIDYPILQGGLMWLARAELAAAVANAGGIGFMTALTHATPGEFRDEIRKVRDLTDKPFGINITFFPTLIPINYDQYIDVAIEEGVTFIETAGRNPESYMEKFKGAGMKIIHKCTSVKHALKAQAIGCDLVSIDGFECADIPGKMMSPRSFSFPARSMPSTFPLLPAADLAMAVAWRQRLRWAQKG